MLLERFFNELTVFKITFDLSETLVLFNPFEPRQLEIDVIVVIDVVNAYDFIAAFQQF